MIDEARPARESRPGVDVAVFLTPWPKKSIVSGSNVAEIPSSDNFFRRLLTRSKSYDLVIAPIGMIGAILAGTKEDFANHPYRTVAIVAAGLAVSVLSVVKASLSFREQPENRGAEDLEGCLQVLYAVLTGDLLEDEVVDAQLRITIHKPIEDGQRLQQIVAYVGAGQAPSDGKVEVNRKFPAQSGIIGQALRRKVPFVMKRQSDDQAAYVRELIEVYGYTEKDAKKASTHVFSWMAIPITEKQVNEEVVRGILYLDSAQRDFFTEDRQTVAKNASLGIAKFVSVRYT